MGGLLQIFGKDGPFASPDGHSSVFQSDLARAGMPVPDLAITDLEIVGVGSGLEPHQPLAPRDWVRDYELPVLALKMCSEILQHH